MELVDGQQLSGLSSTDKLNLYDILSLNFLIAKLIVLKARQILGLLYLSLISDIALCVWDLLVCLFRNHVHGTGEDCQ